MKNENVIVLMSNMISTLERLKLEYDVMLLLKSSRKKINYIK